MLQLLFDFFSGKAKTRIYTTFLGWVLVLHLDILFIALFTDQAIIFEKTGQLKGEYVWSYITSHGWWTIPAEIGRLAIASLITYLMIWVIPKLINKKSYEAELEVEYSLRKMKVDKDDELNKREEVAVKQQLDNIESEKQVFIERSRLEETPEHIKWDEDYAAFIKTDAFQRFNALIRIVYEFAGEPSQAPRRISPTIMAYLDASGIISLSQGRVGFTDKGKYFVQKFNESQIGF